MKYYLLFILSTFLYSSKIDNSFITKYEYGAMLYKNPRGVGCIKCHKNTRKKEVFVKYFDRKNIEKIIIIPPISKLTYKQFSKVLRAKKNSSLIMPTYFLTTDELRSLYFYIKNMK
ncbi:MAG: hypothetical protein HRT40_10870 [Campylobacteraceae bacterium]|nr:hypothetical protein [Campylobacteraceae bacterium]